MQYKYLIHDEEGGHIRWVCTKAEAEEIVSIREGWGFTYHQPPAAKQKLDDLGEAPF